MPGALTPSDVFEMARTAAVEATGPDERPLQIDYPSLKTKLEAALSGRKVGMVHINRFLPEGYEEQGRFNLVLITQGKVLYDIVIGDHYFRYDVTALADVDKVQLVDGVYENKEKRQEEPFLSLRLMHADEMHLLLALNDQDRKSVLAFAEAVLSARHPER
jgi:hypothetical protein